LRGNSGARQQGKKCLTKTLFISKLRPTKTLVFLIGTLSFTSFSHADVCERTPQVRVALEEITKKNCRDIGTENLSKIKLLDLSRSGISHLKADDFSGLPSLQGLYLDRNQLTALPGTLFKGLSSLKRLSLNNNQLTALPETLFSGLSSLQVLYLSENELTALPETLFSELSSLKELRLEDNQLNDVARLRVLNQFPFATMFSQRGTER
jgi:Leucine-rich repeat (LRR) protein